MINRQFSINKKCLDCIHLGYCQPYWGAACKRQGGDKSPRLKSVHAKRQNLSEKKQKTIQLEKLPRPKLNMSQPIKTKRVHWDLTL